MCALRLRVALLILFNISLPHTHAEEPAIEKKPTAAEPSARDIFDLNVDELVNVRITSVSKREERVLQADSAIYVITHEDIRRSGVTHVAEALRMAPGVNVAQANANKWAVSVRGFQGVFSNKLLVLLDGRSVYSPLFAGVYWDVQDLMLEDVERIEVIRGPGATLWGANAVNGVINIITKNSQSTQGGVVAGTGGEETRALTSVRYGGNVGKKINYRVYAKYGDRDDSKLFHSDTDAKDAWKDIRGGFRVDWLESKENTITAQGDYYDGSYEQRATTSTLTAPFAQTITKDAHVSGGNLLGRWQHRFSDTSDMALQLYYDRTVRDESFGRQEHNTGDIDFNHHLQLDRHELIYGLSYRIVDEDLNFNVASFAPNHDLRHVASAFLQDDISIIRDRLRLTLGSKIEHNDFTGFEVQPNVRVLWTPQKKHAVWAAVSRALRTPNPAETAITLRGAVFPGENDVPNLLAQIPNHDISSEELIAYELGYRATLHKHFSIDAAGFYNVYDNLRTAEVLSSRLEINPPPAHTLIPIQLQSRANGETFGGEIAATWSVTDWWKLSGSYSFLKMQLHTETRSTATTAENAERNNPMNQANLRSFMNLPHKIELDTAIYYVDHIPLSNISSYVRLDARVGWQATKKLELSIVGQNLLDNRHQESGPSLFESATEIERNLYFKLLWKF
jgi:iron complex outermembrane recepter protein